MKFWGRLVKRLLPAAAFVLGAVIVASVLWLPKLRWLGTIKEVVAATLYLENWKLAFSSVDYLDRENALSPVQHYWALSVQGQFYVMWPILFAGVALVATRLRARWVSLLQRVLLGIFAVSLAYSVFATHKNQPFAYFNTLARVWEFAIGGFLATVLPTLELSPKARLISGWLGLSAILTCGLVLQVGAVFPGYAALWPTLGAALVLAAGTSGSRWGADRLLGSRPLAYVGDVSYSFYLWHWPVLVFYRLLSDRTELGIPEGLAVLAASFALAALTTRWVENPVRFSAIGRARPGRALALGAAVASVLLAATGAWVIAYSTREGS